MPLSNIPIRAYKNWEIFYVLLLLLWEPTSIYLLVSLAISKKKKIDYFNLCLVFSNTNGEKIKSSVRQYLNAGYRCLATPPCRWWDVEVRPR